MNLDRKPDTEIDGLSFNTWCGSCVYAWKRGDRYLYIGSSSRGLSRPLCHSVIGVAERVQDSDIVEAWFFEEEYPESGLPQFLLFEAAMINRHRPLYNVTDNPDRRPKPSKKQRMRIEYEKAIAERKRQNDEAVLAGWSDVKSWDE